MEKEKSEILSKISKDPGFKVPDNYFENFADNMTKSLPQRQIQEEKKPTLWHFVRPWVYMAAMFAGIWCMMNLFTLMRNDSSSLNPSIAEAFKNESFVDDFMMTNDFNNYDLMQQVYEDSAKVESSIESNEIN